jgi:hypothetical protein
MTVFIPCIVKSLCALLLLYCIRWMHIHPTFAGCKITYRFGLLEAGVPVTAVRYHGTIHDFVMLNAITDDPAPRAAIEQASIMLKKALSD